MIPASTGSHACSAGSSPAPRARDGDRPADGHGRREYLRCASESATACAAAASTPGGSRPTPPPRATENFTSTVPASGRPTRASPRIAATAGRPSRTAAAPKARGARDRRVDEDGVDGGRGEHRPARADEPELRDTVLGPTPKQQRPGDAHGGRGDPRAEDDPRAAEGDRGRRARWPARRSAARSRRAGRAARRVPARPPPARPRSRPTAGAAQHRGGPHGANGQRQPHRRAHGFDAGATGPPPPATAGTTPCCAPETTVTAGMNTAIAAVKAVGQRDGRRDRGRGGRPGRARVASGAAGATAAAAAPARQRGRRRLVPRRCRSRRPERRPAAAVYGFTVVADPGAERVHRPAWRAPADAAAATAPPPTGRGCGDLVVHLPEIEARPGWSRRAARPAA